MNERDDHDAESVWDRLWFNVNLATMVGPGYGEIRDGAIATRHGKIAWIGARTAIPRGARPAVEHDCHGQWLTPGLIDCHTP